MLITSLRQNAAYVQSLAGNDLTLLLSSGYQAASTNRAQTQLATPNIIQINNGLTTQLVVRTQGVSNARVYESQVMNGSGSWVAVGSFPKARNITLTGLTPGQKYSVQIRAVGGLTGYSDWSDPVSHMVM